ncbi:hypothetical protein DERF_013679 [Dermatophagoides farinae]|uniref:Distal membrane-arm assembly complex protein 1-like domain-containing protein n=1 Tax=Dermatophagoides farinae TaxID=6954 RepID=A0A922KVP6_DERFA|nr:hypothetical protein HUG17_0972 [Dermatophagoides farinae]KAH9497716.1 hypothetical protein DERF_013679 [Dermatophagoides farinae]
MLDRIFNYRSSSSTTPESGYEDCFQCRMIGGGGLIGLGSYIIYYSFQRRNIPTANKLSVFASAFIGSVVMTLGTLRLLGIHELDNVPIKQSKKIQHEESRYE